MPKKNILIFFAILYLINAYLFNPNTMNYRSFVWFALISNFFLGAVAIVVTAIVTVVKGKDDAFRNTFRTLMSGVPLVIFHLFCAVFLSFLAYWNEFSFMTPEKALKKDIPLSDFIHVLLTYVPFYFPYLLTKSQLFFAPPSSLHGGFVHVRDSILLVITSFIIPLTLLNFWDPNSLQMNAASFYGISIFLFVPWSLFFDRDIFAHKEDKVPLFRSTTQFPVKVTEKGPGGWGFLFMGFGLVFIGVSFVGFSEKFSPYILASLALFLPFFLMGSLFFVIGLNMQWGQREITITPTDVSGRVRILLPWPRITTWTLPLIDYQRPSKDVQYHRGDADSAAYTTYEIKLNLKVQTPKKKFSLEPDRNIILYRAYHPDNLDQELAQYRQLFSFMER